MTRALIAGSIALLLSATHQAAAQSVAREGVSGSPEARAVAFLVREVPRWKVDNDCYSCHNNGDAARALIAAAARGYEVGAALDDTLAWLGAPARWEQNKITGGINDKPLARVQFASALARAVGAGRASADALGIAAGILVADQKTDGSWQLDTSQSLGSPTTYGTALATASARRVLDAAAASPSPGVSDAIARADGWLRTASVESVLDAAAIILGLGGATDSDASAQRDRALTTIARGQARNGGWGPYVTVGPQVFDTALVMLALSEWQAAAARPATALTADGLKGALARGRVFLLSQQVPDGSWPETTRPANQDSYAQRISTTGWALLALLATN